MSIERISKWIVVIAILAGVVRMLMTPMALIYGVDSPQEMWPGFIACVLMTVGAIGLYLAQADKIGVLGFIGFILLTIGNVLVSIGAFTTLIGFQPTSDVMFFPILLMGCLTLGSILFSVATYRAKVLPRSGAVLMVVFILMMFSPAGSYLALAWGLSYIILGYGVLKNSKEAKSVDLAA
ncbi:hypothetical protein IM538_02985 [Cytobacillus suaedae]|nr:hypothetical protein IM538_02985 [Cytobacillus suaedae]